jgi:hypothetical protein
VTYALLAVIALMGWALWWQRQQLCEADRDYTEQFVARREARIELQQEFARVGRCRQAMQNALDHLERGHLAKARARLWDVLKETE